MWAEFMRDEIDEPPKWLFAPWYFYFYVVFMQILARKPKRKTPPKNLTDITNS